MRKALPAQVEPLGTAPTLAAPSVSPADPLMRLRDEVAAATGLPWHQAIRLRPLSDDADAAVAVYAKLVDGTLEWVGNYPSSLDDATRAAVITDVQALRSDERSALVTDADGDVVTDTSLVGKRKVVRLADGRTAEVQVRNSAPTETDSQERDRTAKELAKAAQVCLMVERSDVVGWNGNFYALQEGENWVPKPVADIYLESVRGDREARAMMNRVISYEQRESYNAAMRAGQTWR